MGSSGVSLSEIIHAISCSLKIVWAFGSAHSTTDAMVRLLLRPWNPEIPLWYGWLFPVRCLKESRESWLWNYDQNYVFPEPKIIGLNATEASDQMNRVYIANVDLRTDSHSQQDYFAQFLASVYSKISRSSLAPRPLDQNTNCFPNVLQSIFEGLQSMKSSAKSGTSKSFSKAASIQTLFGWQIHALAKAFPLPKLIIYILLIDHLPQLKICCQIGGMKS